MSKVNYKRVKYTEFICLECGEIKSVYLPGSVNLPKYYNRNLWCYKCGNETNHINIEERNATRFNLDSIIEDRKLSFDEWLVYEALNKRNKVRKRER